MNCSFFKLPGAIVVCLALVACQTIDRKGREVMAKGPAEPGGFVEDADRMTVDPELDAVHRIWYAPGFQFAAYQGVAVAPVHTAYLQEMSIWEELSLATPRIERDVEKLAVEFREKVQAAMRAQKDHELVEQARPGDLNLELALIEVVPNKEWLGLIGLASWGNPIIPAGVAGGTLAAFLDRGWISIEGRVRDVRSGELVVTFADSEMGKTRIVDLEVLTWYGHAHEIFDDWARQFVARLNTPLDQPVAEAPWFTLKPW
jgi:hypothetical protein